MDKDDNPVSEAPPLQVPDDLKYIWDWYHSLSARLMRVRDGICFPIEPVQFAAWRDALGLVIRPSEYDLLCAMDAAYCDEMGKELTAHREREKDRMSRK